MVWGRACRIDCVDRKLHWMRTSRRKGLHWGALGSAFRKSNHAGFAWLVMGGMPSDDDEVRYT